MIVNFDCEFCGRGQASPASNAGKTVTCRYCGGDCVVPRGAQTSAGGAPGGGPQAGGYQAGGPQTGGPQSGGPGHAIGTPVGGGPEKTTYHPPPQGDPFRPPQQGQRPPSGRRPPQPGHNPYQAPRAELGQTNYHQPGVVPPEVNNAATAAIVCGALGWAVCFLFAPFAVWQAGKASDLAARAGVKVPVTATIGKVLGIIQLVLFVGVFFLAILGGALQ